MVRRRWRAGNMVLAVAFGLLLALSQAGVALAAEGDLDLSFDTDGKRTVDFNTREDVGYGVAVYGDGRIVVAGKATSATSSDFGVLRLLANGQPDPAFSGDGEVMTDIGANTFDEGHAVAIQPDGKIVVAGSSAGMFAVVRYLSNGNPDPDFGTGGEAAVTVGAGNSAAAWALVIQGDGKILVAGSANQNFALLRLLANGTPDNSFDGDGRVITDFSAEADEARALALAGNKIVVAGSATVSGAYRYAVARYNMADGSLDTSFGSGGKVTTAFPENPARANGVIVQQNGKVVVAGQVYDTDTKFDFGLARYNVDGGLDPDFGSGGIMITDFSSSDDFANALIYDAPSGTLTAAGYSYAGLPQNMNFALARYTSKGQLDTTFGSGGRVRTDFNSTYDQAWGMAVAPGGKLVVAGRAANPADLAVSDFAVARYAYNPPPCAINFSDVAPTDYFYEPVRYLTCQGVISGYGDGTFRPYADTTRGQLAKIVVGAEGWSINTTGGPHFNDVSNVHTFYPFIETAYNRGVISGYGDGSFKPQNPVTRGQLSKIVVNARGWPLLNPPTPTFVDVPNTNPFYREIETAVSRGIISGYDIGGGQREFRWGNNATRGQIAKIVYEAVAVLQLQQEVVEKEAGEKK